MNSSATDSSRLQTHWWQTFVARMTLLIGLILALVVLGICCALYVAIRTPLQNSIHDNAIELGHSHNAGITDAVQDRLQAIRLLASRPQTMRATREFLHDRKDPQEYVRQCWELLAPLLPACPDARDYWICDLTGEVIFSTRDDQLGQTWNSSEEFRQGKEEPYASPIQKSEQNYLVTLAAPMQLDGELVAVAMATWDFTSPVKKLAPDPRLNDSCEIILARLSETGLTPMTPVPSKPDVTSVALPADHPLRRLTTGESLTEWTDWNGRATLAALESVGFQDWVTLTKFDQTKLNEPLSRLWKVFWTASPLALLVGLGLVYLVSLDVARPIGEVTRAARTLQSGDFSTRVRPDGYGEVNELARAFNSLVAYFEASSARLEERVRERTSALSASQAALHDQNQVLESIFASITDGIVVSDREGRWLFMNPAARGGQDPSQVEVLSSYSDWARVYGLYMPDKVTLVPTEKLPPVRALRGEMVRDVPVVVKNDRTPQGRWLVTSSSPIRDAEGKITGAVSVFRDVSQQLIDQAELHRQEQRIVALMDNTGSVIYIKDLHGRYLLVNKQFEDLFHVTRKDASGRTDAEIFGPDEAKVFTANDRIVAETGEGQSFEEIALHADGPHSYVSVKFPLRNQLGEVEAIGGISTDITQLKVIEKALQESNERFSLVLRGSTDGIFDWNIRSNEVYFSPRWKSMIGYEMVELDNVFSTWESRLHPDDKESVVSTLNAYLRNEIPAYEVEFRLRHKDGSYRWILSRGVVLRDQAGKPFRMAGSHVDITARKESEQALKRLTEELARRNEDLEQFAHVASHDLQEPLRMIASYVELLEHRYKDRLDATANEYIQFAVEGVYRMQKLIQDLLALCRLGSAGSAHAPVSLQKAAELAVTNLQVAIRESNATIHMGELPTVPGDQTQLTQLFQNLVSNAIRFRSAQPPRIDISCEIRDDICHCEVRDNGIGFEPQYAEKIFVAFQRLHPSSEYPGSGVGLAICKRVVELHRGQISATSEPGRGATIHFSIPLSAPRNELGNYDTSD